MTPRRTLVRRSLPLLAALAFAMPALADGGHRGSRFEVTITNLTRGQQFTPVLLASHDAGVRLFRFGMPASAELATLAEEGNTAPLAAALSPLPGTGHVVSGSGLTNPGASTKLVIEGGGRFDRFSLAAMLIPTNDGFVAVRGARLPHGGQPLTLLAAAYDAGSERNDELCASIPGPQFVECGGSGGGGMPAGGEEGFVHVHAGMHGIGDFLASNRDWRNPVALITVRRVR